MAHISAWSDRRNRPTRPSKSCAAAEARHDVVAIIDGERRRSRRPRFTFEANTRRPVSQDQFAPGAKTTSAHIAPG